MDYTESEARSTRIYPITFHDYGKLHAIPGPLARISLCGMIEVEVLTEVISDDPPQGCYEVVSPQKLRGRGAVPSLMLLKLLVSSPHRFATSDWLSEHMCGEMEVGALVRLDTIASYLRGVLCRIKTEQEEIVDALRLVLVSYLRNGRGSGPGYQLAAHPLLWVDIDALTAHIEQAARLERFGDSAVALLVWERAYQLASRGVYLPDDPFTEWANDLRGTISGMLRQSVHALHRLYLAQQSEHGEEQAMVLLRTYWFSHKTDEDALRPLMELLGLHERYQEAEEYYQQLNALRTQEGRSPDSRTQDVYEFLQTKQITRELKSDDPYIVPSLTSAFQPSNQRLAATASTVSTTNFLTLPISTMQRITFTETMALDQTTIFGFTLGQMIALIEKWYGMALFCHDLQDQLDRKIKTLDTLKSQYSLETYSLSRRSFLIAIAGLPAASLTFSREAYRLSVNLEEFLPQCAASITSCWHLSGGSHLDAIALIIDSYLPTLITVTKHSPSYREIAADLAAQCYFLKAILAWHLEGLDRAENYCIRALHYSNITKNTNLRLTALNQHALILYYAKQFPRALSKSEEACAILQQAPHNRIFPIVQGRVYMYLAAMQAQQLSGNAEQTLEQGQKAFALQSTRAEPVPLYADCGEAPLTLWDGLTHYHLSLHDMTHAERALNSLRTFGQLQSSLSIPERFRLECLTNRILATIQCDEMEEAIECFELARQGAKALESKQRSSEVDYAYLKIGKRWSNEERVKKLKPLSLSEY